MTDFDKEHVYDQRRMIEHSVSSCLGSLYTHVDVDKTIRTETMLMIDKLCQNIRDIYISQAKADTLSGEFNLDAAYLVGTFDMPGRKVPLYFALDLMINVLETKYMQYGDVKDTIDILKSLRNDLATLSFNSSFEPKEAMAEDTKAAIIKAKGDFTIKKMTKNGISFIGVKPVLTQYDDKRSLTPLGDFPIYERDAKAVKKIREEQLRRLYEITSRYYYHNQMDPIPTSKQFYDYLMDVKTDERIKRALKEISYLKERYYYNELLVEEAGKYMAQIEEVERELHQQTEENHAIEEKNMAIANARARYQEKSFLWRFFKRKMSPAKLDMENMNVEEINDLYTDTKKGRVK